MAAICATAESNTASSTDRVGSEGDGGPGGGESSGGLSFGISRRPILVSRHVRDTRIRQCVQALNRRARSWVTEVVLLTVASEAKQSLLRCAADRF